MEFDLQPHLATLACDKFGSRVVDQLWASLPMKG